MVELIILLAGCATWFVVFIMGKHVFMAARQARIYNQQTKAMLRTIELGQLSHGVFDDGKQTTEENNGRRAGYYQSIS